MQLTPNRITARFLIVLLLCIAGILFYAGKVVEAEQGASSVSLRVTKVKLRASPIDYNGPCPAEIKFQAKITVTGGAGNVVCRIVGNDDTPGPEMTIPFNHPGTKDTTYSWTTEESFLGWQQLEIMQPNKLKSNRAEFSVMCVSQ